MHKPALETVGRNCLLVVLGLLFGALIGGYLGSQYQKKTCADTLGLNLLAEGRECFESRQVHEMGDLLSRRMYAARRLAEVYRHGGSKEEIRARRDDYQNIIMAWDRWLGRNGVQLEHYIGEVLGANLKDKVLSDFQVLDDAMDAYGRNPKSELGHDIESKINSLNHLVEGFNLGVVAFRVKRASARQTDMVELVNGGSVEDWEEHWPLLKAPI